MDYCEQRRSESHVREILKALGSGKVRLILWWELSAVNVKSQTYQGLALSWALWGHSQVAICRCQSSSDKVLQIFFIKWKTTKLGYQFPVTAQTIGILFWDLFWVFILLETFLEFLGILDIGNNFRTVRPSCRRLGGQKIILALSA